MATKTKRKTTRKVVAKKPAAAVPAVAAVTVHVHPKFAEFRDAKGNIESRFDNGPRNSDAFAQLAKHVIRARESGASVSLKFFDAQGAEVIDAEQAESLSTLL